MTPVLASILFGAAAAAVAFLALVMVRFAAGFTRANGPVFAAFAGGIVITIALVHLLPRALAGGEGAPWLVLAGFGAGFLLHAAAGIGAHHPEAVRRGAAFAPVAAIALHSVLDGLVYSVTLTVDAVAGFGAAAGLVLHELPEAVVCFVLLQRAGLSDRASLIGAWLAAGATTFAAAALSAPYAAGLEPGHLDALFAVVAGLLLHVGAARLMTEAAEIGLLRGGGAVIAGAGVAALMSLAHAGHDHGHDAHDGHDHAGFDRPDFRPVSHEP
ncbi:MAG: zinc ABC transporter permease [Oceanicaulis sp.]